MDKYHQHARNATANYRTNNAMPPGTQVQHWTKVLSAKQTSISPHVMNKNLSPLQSRNNLPATTLLTDPKGGGTRYTVQGGSSYGNEHKFADRFLINKERANIRAANPTVSARAEVIAAGEVARWKMTGDPGPSRYTAVRSTARPASPQAGVVHKPPTALPSGTKPPTPQGGQQSLATSFVAKDHLTGKNLAIAKRSAPGSTAAALPKAEGAKAVGSMSLTNKLGAVSQTVGGISRVAGLGSTMQRVFGGLR